MERLYKITIPDFILTILTIAVSGWLLVGFTSNSGGPGTLAIYKDGVLLQEAALDRDQIINLPGRSGPVEVEITVEHGVRIRHSDCPAQICVHTGWIKQPGETIVCLPNKILLEIKGTGEGYHAISY